MMTQTKYLAVSESQIPDIGKVKGTDSASHEEVTGGHFADIYDAQVCSRYVKQHGHFHIP